jgi:hypothetical protein
MKYCVKSTGGYLGTTVAAAALVYMAHCKSSSIWSMSLNRFTKTVGIAFKVLGAKYGLFMRRIRQFHAPKFDWLLNAAQEQRVSDDDASWIDRALRELTPPIEPEWVRQNVRDDMLHLMRVSVDATLAAGRRREGLLAACMLFVYNHNFAPITMNAMCEYVGLADDTIQSRLAELRQICERAYCEMHQRRPPREMNAYELSEIIAALWERSEEERLMQRTTDGDATTSITTTNTAAAAATNSTAIEEPITTTAMTMADNHELLQQASLISPSKVTSASRLPPPVSSATKRKRAKASAATAATQRHD